MSNVTLTPEARAKLLREYRTMCCCTATPRHVYADRCAIVMRELGFIESKLDADQAVYVEHADLMGDGRQTDAAAIEAAHPDLFPLAAE
jgi:hypothetical protein